MSEPIDRLVTQWGSSHDALTADAALRHIALLTGCTQPGSSPLTEIERRRVLQWLQDNHLYAYLLAMSQRSVGHPAMIWGTYLNPQAKLISVHQRPA